MKYRCIDNDDGLKSLTIGRVYDGTLSGEYLETIGDHGRPGSYYACRFEPVTDPDAWRTRTVTLGWIADAMRPLVRGREPGSIVREALVNLAWDISQDHDFQMACGFEKKPTFVDPGMA